MHVVNRVDPDPDQSRALAQPGTHGPPPGPMEAPEDPSLPGTTPHFVARR